MANLTFQRGDYFNIPLDLDCAGMRSKPSSYDSRTNGESTCPSLGCHQREAAPSLTWLRPSPLPLARRIEPQFVSVTASRTALHLKQPSGSALLVEEMNPVHAFTSSDAVPLKSSISWQFFVHCKWNGRFHCIQFYYAVAPIYGLNVTIRFLDNAPHLFLFFSHC